MNINIFNQKSEQDQREFVQLSVPEKYNEPQFIIKKNVIVYNNIILNEEVQNEFPEFYKYWINSTKGKIIEGLDQAQTIKHKGKYLFLAHGFSGNYSHFTLQVFGSLLCVFNMNILTKDTKVIIYSEKKFTKQLLELFSHVYHIDYEYIYFTDKSIHIFENCIIPDIILDQVNFSKVFIKNFENFARLLYQPSHISTAKKIYITRLHNTTRIALNENDVVVFMSQKGYSIVDFDKISVLDQIHYINGADEIVAAHGASCANLVYALHQFKFIESFSRGRFTNVYLKICSQKNCQYSACVNNANHTITKDAPYYVDLQLLEKALNTTCHSFNNNNEDKIYNINTIYQNLSKLLPREYFLQQEYVSKLKKGELNVAFDLAQQLFALDYKNIPYLALMCRIIGVYDIAWKAFDQITQIISPMPMNYMLLSCNLFKDQNRYDEIISYINQSENIDQYIDYLKRINFIKNLPANSIKTWHDTVLAVDQDCQHLVQLSALKNYDYLILCDIKSDHTIALKINKTQQYLASIDSKGNITLNDQIHYFPIVYNKGNLFGIKIDDKYFLSAKPDGTFQNGLYLREWELLKI